MSYNNMPVGSSLQWIKDTYEGKMVLDSRSPAGNWLEFELANIVHGVATLKVLVRHEMTNPYGNIHGGMMALIIDESMGWAIASLSTENHFTSMSLNVDFLYAIKGGDTLTSVAKVVRSGKRIINIDCYVYNSEGTVLAHGTSNLIATKMEFVG